MGVGEKESSYSAHHEFLLSYKNFPFRKQVVSKSLGRLLRAPGYDNK